MRGGSAWTETVLETWLEACCWGDCWNGSWRLLEGGPPCQRGALPGQGHVWGTVAVRGHTPEQGHSWGNCSLWVAHAGAGGKPPKKEGGTARNQCAQRCTAEPLCTGSQPVGLPLAWLGELKCGCGEVLDLMLFFPLPHSPVTCRFLCLHFIFLSAWISY